MPRRSVLSPAEWDGLLAVPADEEDLIREYTFTASEMELVRRRRGGANRLGLAVQLAYMKYPGTALGVAEPARQVVETVAAQIGADPALWAEYGRRDETRREHARELQDALGLRQFTDAIRAELVDALEDDAVRTDKGTAIAEAAIATLRSWDVLLPGAGVLDSAAAEAITRGNRLVYEALASQLEDRHRRALDRLLGPADTGHGTRLGWLRQSPLRPNSKHAREHLERLRAWRALGLPAGLKTAVRQNRLLKLAREGAQMTPGDLAKLEPQRRYATLAALAIESTMTVTDEILDLNDRVLGKVFTTARNRHRDAFHDAGREINDKVRLYGRIGGILLASRDEGTDPFEAIDTAIGWEAFRRSVDEAQALARPQDFDSLPGIRHSYAMLRRYTPDLLGST